MTRNTAKTILLVDGDTVFAAAQERAIKNFGFDVIVAESGETALELAARGVAMDMALLDIDLGNGLDGPETARRLLEKRDLPIVFLLGDGAGADLNKINRIAYYGMISKSSNAMILQASIEMAFALFAAQQEHIKRSGESEARLQFALETSQIGAWDLDLLDHTAVRSIEHDRIFGYAELLPEWTFEMFLGHVLPEDRAVVAQKFQVAIDRQSNWEFECRIRRTDGDVRWIWAAGRHQFDRTNTARRMAGIVQDITARKQRENETAAMRALLQAGIESPNDIIIMAFDCEYRYLFFNTVHKDVMRRAYGADVAVGMNLLACITVESDRQKSLKNFGRALAGESHSTVQEFGDMHKDYYESFYSPIRDSHGEIVGASVFAHNITERKLAEQKIENLLTEKDFILKEVHHRIKNNMASVVSLLGLQADKLSDPAAIAALKDAGGRVQSMMVLYDKLYHSLSFDRLAIELYLPALVNEIAANLPHRADVRVETHIDHFDLAVHRLQLLGIMINELLSNVMKYAFIGRTDGLVLVSACLQGGRVAVTIADNGGGLPAEIDFEHSTGFGLQLVAMLARQLDGAIRIERENGTRIVLEFDK